MYKGSVFLPRSTQGIPVPLLQALLLQRQASQEPPFLEGPAPAAPHFLNQLCPRQKDANSLPTHTELEKRDGANTVREVCMGEAPSSPDAEAEMPEPLAPLLASVSPEHERHKGLSWMQTGMTQM